MNRDPTKLQHLVRSTRILRRVLETFGDFLSLTKNIAHQKESNNNNNNSSRWNGYRGLGKEAM